MLNAWQTVWVCVGLSVVGLLLDAWFAARSGAHKDQQAREAARQRRVS